MDGWYWIEDPGHEWLVVPTAEVQRVGFAPSAFSFHSPLRGLAYLEGDVDAGGFLTQAGAPIPHPARHINSFDQYIRQHGLVRYQGETNAA